MENNNQNKVCKHCGFVKPIEEFSFVPLWNKHSDVCKSCVKEKQSKTRKNNIEKSEQELNPNPNPLLAHFDSRDLILELRARGYKGKLVYVVEKEVVI